MREVWRVVGWCCIEGVEVGYIRPTVVAVVWGSALGNAMMAILNKGTGEGSSDIGQDLEESHDSVLPKPSCTGSVNALREGISI
jgi:hypothetical protein